LKVAGTLKLARVSETEKREEPVSVILNRFPLVVPFVPILIVTRSPVAVVEEPGDQSRAANFPEVRAVEVAAIFNIVPVVRLLAEYGVKRISAEAVEVPPKARAWLSASR